jgi:hypothetical protein
VTPRTKAQIVGRDVLVCMAMWFGTGTLLWTVIFIAGRIGITP